MEEMNHTLIGEFFNFVVERHSLYEWGFLFIFFLIIRFFLSKSEHIGPIFLSISSDDENIFKHSILGFLIIYGCSALLCFLIFGSIYLAMMASPTIGLFFSSFNLVNLSIECAFMWALVAVSHTSKKQIQEHKDEIESLKTLLGKRKDS